ncbi:uncharacterized protein LOC127248452 [Andrographis paniculata]|uniref:uncharacterized protein LOC127248452 n=1 Tax=Andrographis paniculata TaxID=175694 RepID=UPI0021E7C760|nr:uncharacterized protein LOC127248452 [Andrographis paniculata]
MELHHHHRYHHHFLPDSGGGRQLFQMSEFRHHGTVGGDLSESSCSSSGEDHDDRTADFHATAVAEKRSTVPRSHESAEKKLQWLRSQIIGGTAEFVTPFGTRRLTYADHTASGRSLRYIENYITANVLPFYGNSHTSDSETGSKTTRMAEEASSYVKKCLGGGGGDAIIFCGSGTTAAIKRLQEVIGVAIPSILRDRVLKCLSAQERWVVFVGPYEHHSNILSWRRSLAEVVEIGLDRRGLLDMDSLRENLELYRSQKRPILGSFSACSNVTGICTDTRAVARLLHQFGGFVCFDYAASGPYEKIEMRSGEMDGYDAIFLSPHKFVGGPGTPGILLMSKALYRLGAAPPSTCGGGTVDYVNGFNEEDTIYVDDVEGREDSGTPPIIQKIRAALAFWVKGLIGHNTIHKIEQIHLKKAFTRLIQNPKIKILGNAAAVKRQPILSFLIHTTSRPNSHIPAPPPQLDLWRDDAAGEVVAGKPLDGRFVAKLLNDLFGIQARGGCACAGPYGHALLGIDRRRSLEIRSAIKKGYNGVKPGWTRVSFPYYMSEEEVEFILAGIEFVALYGQRFLPLYHFSWRKGVWTFKKNALQDKVNGLTFADIVNVGRNNDSCLEIKQEDSAAAAVRDYAGYLEFAKQMADLLPRFPAGRRVPEDIDVDLIAFRV